MKRGKVPPDPRGGHVRLHWVLLDSPAWLSLSATDQRAYVTLRRALGKTNNGDISLPLSRAKHYGITSPATLAKALRALGAVGLIAVTRRGGCTRGGQRLPTLYRFTDEPTYAMPAKHVDAFGATDEWKAVTSIAQGKALIRQADTAARKKAQERNPLQFSNGTAIAGEVVTPSTSTAAEAWALQPLRNVKQVPKAGNTGSASNDAGFGNAGSVKH